MTTASLEIERTVKIPRYQCLVSAKAVQMDSLGSGSMMMFPFF